MFMAASEPWLLAFDLSSPRGVLVLEARGDLFSRVVPGGSRVSHLFTAASEVMSLAGIDTGDVDLIGVGRGPGSFTGVRVAVMAAKTLATVLEVPLVAPDSLEVLSMGAEGLAEAVMVAQDARRGQLYYGFYHFQEGYPVIAEGPCVAGPERVAERLSVYRKRFPSGIAITGTGVNAFPRIWPRDLEVISGDSPTPLALSRLCRRYAANGQTRDHLELLPSYIRRPDAREGFAGGRGGAGK
jgi:tRNA threonylcarbamoyladenosine biosynthesis protein TsaB